MLLDSDKAHYTPVVPDSYSYSYSLCTLVDRFIVMVTN
jgi:hypothetical protein